MILLSLSFPSPSLTPKNNRVTRLSKHWIRQCTACFQMQKNQTRREKIKNSWGFFFPLSNHRCYYDNVGKIFSDGGVIFEFIISVSSDSGWEVGTHQLLCAGALAHSAEWRAQGCCSELCSSISLHMIKLTRSLLAVQQEAISRFWLSPDCTEFSGTFCFIYLTARFFLSGNFWLLSREPF